MKHWEEQYRKEVDKNKDYRISKEEFAKFLESDEKTKKSFYNKLEWLEEEENYIYYIAVDYSIPITMVKHFHRQAQTQA